MRTVTALAISLALGGCGVGTVINVATAPVRAASKTVDLATTSQSERDEKRGRALRKLEARYGKLDQEFTKQDKQCLGGDTESCVKRDGIAAEMSAIRPRLPADPE
ncbi:MAG: hypothetical protein ACKOOL_02695 [Novosphingobium sp.]